MMAEKNGGLKLLVSPAASHHDAPSLRINLGGQGRKMRTFNPRIEHSGHMKRSAVTLWYLGSSVVVTGFDGGVLWPESFQQCRR
jgi:hypothetical protein